MIIAHPGRVCAPSRIARACARELWKDEQAPKDHIAMPHMAIFYVELTEKLYAGRAYGKR